MKLAKLKARIGRLSGCRNVRRRNSWVRRRIKKVGSFRNDVGCGGVGEEFERDLVGWADRRGAGNVRKSAVMRGVLRGGNLLGGCELGEFAGVPYVISIFRGTNGACFSADED